MPRISHRQSMASTSEADWDIAKGLYLQGFTAREVAEKTGISLAAIESRASRDSWRVDRRTSRLEQAADAAESWQIDMILFLRKRAEALMRILVPADPAGLKQLEGIVCQHIETGRKILGLDRPQAQDSRGLGAIKGARVIDVAEVQVATPAATALPTALPAKPTSST